MFATVLRLTFVAWDQHIGMPAGKVLAASASGRYAKAGNFTTIGDHKRVRQFQTGARGNEIVQGGHLAAFPQKRVFTGNVAEFFTLRISNDLAARIYAVRPAARITL